MAKINVYRISDKKDKKSIVIGITNKVELGVELSRFEEFKNIKYQGETTIQHNNSAIKVHKIEFSNLDETSYSVVESIALDAITKFDESATLYDIFNKINDYFSKEDRKKKIVKELIGDLGEIAFIYKAQEFGINATQYYQNTEFSLYDFIINKKAVDIKTASTRKKTINVTYRQLYGADNVSFVVVEINKIHGFSTILDILNKIKYKNDHLQNLQNKWKIISKYFKNIVESWTLNLKSINIIEIDKTIIPDIKILKNGGLTEMRVEINFASGKNKLVSKSFFDK